MIGWLFMKNQHFHIIIIVETTVLLAKLGGFICQGKWPLDNTCFLVGCIGSMPRFPDSRCRLSHPTISKDVFTSAVFSAIFPSLRRSLTWEHWALIGICFNLWVWVGEWDPMFRFGGTLSEVEHKFWHDEMGVGKRISSVSVCSCWQLPCTNRHNSRKISGLPTVTHCVPKKYPLTRTS